MLRSWNLPRADPESSRREGLWQQTIGDCPGGRRGNEELAHSYTSQPPAITRSLSFGWFALLE